MIRAVDAAISYQFCMSLRSGSSWRRGAEMEAHDNQPNAKLQSTNPRANPQQIRHKSHKLQLARDVEHWKEREWVGWGREATHNNSHDSPVDKVVTFCGTKCFLLLHDCNLHKLIRKQVENAFRPDRDGDRDREGDEDEDGDVDKKQRQRLYTGLPHLLMSRGRQRMLSVPVWPFAAREM